MQPVLFEVGQFKLYSFGTFIALGALIGGIVLFRILKYRKMRTSHLFDTVLYTLIIALIRARQPTWEVIDALSLSFLVGWAIGKIGCQLSSCTIGRSSESWIAINGMLPIDLISSIWAIIVFGVLLYVYLKDRLTSGVIFFLSTEAFFLGELLIKTLKADFGEGIVRAEAMIYLSLIAITYLLFWRLHGPRLEKTTIQRFWGNITKRFHR